MKIDRTLTPERLLPAIEAMWQVSGGKILSIDATLDRSAGAPVHTVAGRYRPRGWTAPSAASTPSRAIPAIPPGPAASPGR